MQTFSDPEIQRAMRREQVQGLAVATIENGKVAQVKVFGTRNAALGQPLTPDTIMAGGSLTKAAFAYMLLQLADEGRLDLDAPVTKLLPHPLPTYRVRPYDFSDLAGDARWQTLTPRILLAHGGGLADYRWMEPGSRLRIHTDPGERYAYSSEGYAILQLIVEEGLGLDVAQEMRRRVFDRFGMRRTSMHWRAEFAENAADGYAFDGTLQPHERRYRVRAAGSMETTIADQAKLWAGIMRGDGLRPDTRAAFTTGWLPIASRRRFPAFGGAETAWPQKLAAGLGVVTFEDRTGPGWFDGGHDDSTADFVLCLETGQRCVVMLSNDVRAERLFPELGRQALGPDDMPWSWEYDWLDQP
ncbi:beta-lactamase family protein [Telluria mixta]|uniref:Beta-lactamase family protein n=1 Tax=Telluria mixta TaxID=34071 RepID=A0ABT2C4U4_9BURK|nr:serine hydrolase domain-containing protein [Telluria mixta]MCS0632409.1 beta-lactamase family protein [Telluria mixta]WEM94838.1 serine hydrolase [Telluria mixta]